MDKTIPQAGGNLSGWLSQYRTYDFDHFRTFITEADIRHIADWGVDHGRLPGDYLVLEDDRQPADPLYHPKLVGGPHAIRLL